MSRTLRLATPAGSNSGLVEILSPAPRSETVGTLIGAALAFIAGKVFGASHLVNPSTAENEYCFVDSTELANFEADFTVDLSAPSGAHVTIRTQQAPGGGKYNWVEVSSGSPSTALADAVAAALATAATTKRSLITMIDTVEDLLRATEGYTTECSVLIDQDTGIVTFKEGTGVGWSADVDSCTPQVNGAMIDDTESVVLPFE